MSADAPWLGPRWPDEPPPRLELEALEALGSFALLAPGFTGAEPAAAGFTGAEPAAAGAASRGAEPWLLLAELSLRDEPPAPRSAARSSPACPSTAPGRAVTALWFCPAERAGAEASRFLGTEGWVSPVLDGGRGLPCTLEAGGFLAGVGAVREAIAAGDVYQVNLTLRATVRATGGAEVLRALCRRGVPRFGAWVRLPDGTEFVSASPELLVERDEATLRVEPMKGTAPPEAAAWLEQSEKDRAELAMITDLLRDDLQRLCLPRSVRVANPRRLVALPYAVQAVSDVTGALADGVGLVDAVDQLHPGGSVTGAPRAAACELIERLESGPRGPYCGFLGLARADERRGRFALLIRTATRRGADLWEYGVGSGITWDSEAEAELAEVRLKLGALA